MNTEMVNYINEDNDLISVETMQQMLGQTISVVKNNSESTAVILKRLEINESIIGGLVSKMNNHNDDIVSIKDRMTERIAEILHFDSDEIAKYYQTFIQRCYKSLKNDNHMGASYRRTKKKYYQTIIDSVEAWIPKEGIQNLKDIIDKRANSKKNAKKNGY